MENDPPNSKPPPTPYASSGTIGQGSWEPGGGRLTAPPPTGYKTASLILMLLGAALFTLGLFPCLGWVNWLGVPANGAAALLGILGLASGPKNPDGSRAYQGYYIAALIVGLVGFFGGAIRCAFGGGLL